MIRITKYLILLILIFFTVHSYSQFYNTGSAPFNVKWKFIKTAHFKLIYPIEVESMAQKYASTLTNLYPFTSQSLNHEPASIDIIMYNQSVLSNAYVVWAPKRMELVTTSPQKQYSHDWLEQLALHEYRHVVQIDKLNQGFTKGLSLFTGQMGVGAMMAFIPLWYLEGDAVVNETALTNTGRGRDPNFIQEVMATEMQEDKRFKYDEFYLGSYKNYVPNHYNYGYQMVAWSRMKYGEQTWSKVLDNVARKPFTLAPFYFRLKKETGLSKVQIYEKTSDYLRRKWLKEDSIRKSNYTESITIETSYKSEFVSYRFPHQNADGTIVALRTSIDDIAKLVHINNGKEKILCRLGYFQGSKIAYSEKYIAWEEIQYDPRWERKDFSVIRLYDRDTRESSVFKKCERHFAPEISPNSRRVCVIKNDSRYNSSIEIYDIESKQLLNSFEPVKNTQFSFPVWLDEEQIAFIMLNEKGKSIELLNTRTSNWKNLLKTGYNNISYLSGKGNDLYFSYTLDGRVNIYHINILTKETHKVTSMAIGANYASIGNTADTLLFSEYSSQGFKPRKISLQGTSQTPLSEITAYKYDLAEATAKQEYINIQDSILPLIEFDSKPYSKLGHMFNIHSWLVPFYINLDALPDENTKLYPGITLLSQNSLSTVTSSISYYYSNGYHFLRPSIAFRFFYPVITFDYLYGGPSRIFTSNAEIYSVPSQINNYNEFNTEVSVPLKFSTSQYSFSATPSIKYRYKNWYVADSVNRGSIDFSQDDIFYYKGYATLDYRFSFFAATKLAYKALRPKWGFHYYFSYQKPLLHTQYWVHYKNTTHFFTVYLPGIFRHQSLQGQIGLENGFGNRMSLPRGYTSVSDYNSAYKFSIDYGFPVLYPNLSLGPFAYFKRVQANIFYDYFNYTFDYNPDYYHNSISSTGIEMSIETNLLRFFWTFVPTIQYSYLIESGNSNLGFYFTTKYGFSLGGAK